MKYEKIESVKLIKKRNEVISQLLTNFEFDAE